MPAKKITDAKILEALAANGNYRQRTADALGMKCTSLRGRLKKMKAAGVAVPNPPTYGKRTEREYMPTPEQVAAAIAEVQASWTPKDEVRRRCEAYQPQPIDFRPWYARGLSTSA